MADDPGAGLSYVFAPALVMAVCGDNLPAVEALLRLEADPNQAARLSVRGSLPVGRLKMPELYSLNPTPLQEAVRLGQ
jgi:hypothetical protein